MRVASLLLLAVLALPAPASDNDERPAYLIYVDPETGKYTTEDPAKREPQRSRELAPGASGDAATPTSPVIAGILVLLMVTVLLRRWLRQRRHAAPPAPSGTNGGAATS